MTSNIFAHIFTPILSVILLLTILEMKKKTLRKPTSWTYTTKKKNRGLVRKKPTKTTSIARNGINVSMQTVNKLAAPLKEILEQELLAGNQISETYEGDWPKENSIMVFLSQPFKTPIKQNIPGIEYEVIDTPHYWKSHYYDLKTNSYLCCSR